MDIQFYTVAITQWLMKTRRYTTDPAPAYVFFFLYGRLLVVAAADADVLAGVDERDTFSVFCTSSMLRFCRCRTCMPHVSTILAGEPDQ